MAGDRGLEPGPGPAGLVEHGGVGDLQLGDGERPVEARLAVLDGEGIGHHRRHPPQQVAEVARAEPCAYAVGGDGGA